MSNFKNNHKIKDNSEHFKIIFKHLMMNESHHRVPLSHHNV